MDTVLSRLASTLLTIFLASVIAFGAVPGEENGDLPYDEEVVIARIKKLKNEVVPPQYNTVVKSYILTYTQRKSEKARRIVGRSVMYFPVFEEYLRRHNLPLDLKYLAVVESALEPKAISSAGAVGLWQFMPSTARWMGLEISPYVDERCDPHRSTEAALNYLERLHKQFDNWELAIAAYNSGGGRVGRAIKRARSKDYWEIRRFLPRETANYVPAFIAACYLMSHYEDHELIPEYPELDLQMTKTIQVFDKYTFYEIAQVTELPLDVIEALNPSYTKGFIPESTTGRYLTLPMRVMPALEDYLRSRSPDPAEGGPLVSAPVFVTRPSSNGTDYVRSVYTVRSGDNIEQIATTFNCRVHQIRAWNQLASDELSPGQDLILFHPKEFKRFTAPKKMVDVAPIATRTPGLVAPETDIWIQEQKSFVTKGGYLFYEVRSELRVFELAQSLSDISIQDLMQLNGFKSPLQALKLNSYVRIKKL